jgi:drug/metabolite transporter (DMT)-like permease
MTKAGFSAGDSSDTFGTFNMNRRRGLTALLVATTGMGLSGLLTRGATRVSFFGTQLVAGQSIGAFMTVGRMACGLVLFAALLALTGKLGMLRRTRVTPSIVLGGLFVGVALACYLVATLLTSLANAVFMIYTGPLFCTILARVFRRERISASQWVCLALVFVGMLFTSGIVTFGTGGLELVMTFGASTPEFPKKGLGDALGLLSGIFYGVSLFMNGYRKDCDTCVRGFWNFLFATAGSLAVALLMAQVWPLGAVEMQPVNWAFACVLWLVCGPLGLGLLLVAGRNLPAVEYSTVAYWECVVCLAASVLVYGEALSAPTILGGALILIGGFMPAVMALKK